MGEREIYCVSVERLVLVYASNFAMAEQIALENAREVEPTVRAWLYGKSKYLSDETRPFGDDEARTVAEIRNGK